MTQPAAYTMEDELDAALASDGLTAGNKLHIQVFLTQPHTAKEQVNFLKREYGTGGRSNAVSGASYGQESFDGKGFYWREQSCEEIHISWAKVVSCLVEIIRLE